jgi:hypothetical protein
VPEETSWKKDIHIGLKTIEIVLYEIKNTGKETTFILYAIY